MKLNVFGSDVTEKNYSDNDNLREKVYPTIAINIVLTPGI